MHHVAHLAAAGIVGLGLFFFCVVALLLYFAPAFCAFIRRSRYRWLIATINLFFGWSVVGWFICLVWAFTDPPRKSTYIGIP